MGFAADVSGNFCRGPRRERNKPTRAVAEWTAVILEDPRVQVRLLNDAQQGRLHHMVLGQQLLYSYGRPVTSPIDESTIPLSALAETRKILGVKLKQIRNVLEAK